jgi:hypothetical protein
LLWFVVVCCGLVGLTANTTKKQGKTFIFGGKVCLWCWLSHTQTKWEKQRGLCGQLFKATSSGPETYRVA